MAVAASYVESLMTTSCKEDVQRAWEILETLSNGHGLGDRTAVLGMRLKVAMRADPVDYDAINAVIVRTIRCTILTPETFRM